MSTPLPRYSTVNTFPPLPWWAKVMIVAVYEGWCVRSVVWQRTFVERRRSVRQWNFRGIVLPIETQLFNTSFLLFGRLLTPKKPPYPRPHIIFPRPLTPLRKHQLQQENMTPFKLCRTPVQVNVPHSSEPFRVFPWAQSFPIPKVGTPRTKGLRIGPSKVV